MLVCFWMCFQLFVGVETGVIVGIVGSLIQVIQHSSYPRMTRVGRLRDNSDVAVDATDYRDVARFPKACFFIVAMCQKSLDQVS